MTFKSFPSARRQPHGHFEHTSTREGLILYRAAGVRRSSVSRLTVLNRHTYDRNRGRQGSSGQTWMCRTGGVCACHEWVKYFLKVMHLGDVKESHRRPCFFFISHSRLSFFHPSPNGLWGGDIQGYYYLKWYIQCVCYKAGSHWTVRCQSVKNTNKSLCGFAKTFECLIKTQCIAVK